MAIAIVYTFVFISCFLTFLDANSLTAANYEVTYPCSANELRCDSGECIQRNMWCDAEVHCRDESDEKFCANAVNPHPRCSTFHFACHDRTCIPRSARCDNFTDCKDGSDEKDCEGVDFTFDQTSAYDVEVSDESYETEISLPKSVHEAMDLSGKWILEQHNDSGWGTELARAITALRIAQVWPSDPQQSQLLLKQLNIQIALNRLNGDESAKLTRLALDINSLVASCQDPRNFQGQDLVHEFKKTKEKTRRESNRVVSPLVYLTLCIVDESSDEDIRALVHICQTNADKLDAKAIAVIALSCLVKQQKYSHYKNQFLQNFKLIIEDYNRTKPYNAYTTALILQMINAGSDYAIANVEDYKASSFDLRLDLNKALSLKFLLDFQKENGSFGDLLSTYYALPALAGYSLADLRIAKCSAAVKDYPSYYRSNAQRNIISVRYSLWIGQDPVTDVHSMQINVRSGQTFFDVMRIAAAKNPLFIFEYEEASFGTTAYEIAGKPNDPEKDQRWILYVNQLDEPKNVPDPDPLHLTPYRKGLDTLLLKHNDHLVFWFRSTN